VVKPKALATPANIARSITVLRSQRVILDAELAALYGVTTKALNQAVKRNGERFPEDFMFRLSAAECAALISRFATSKSGRGGRRNLTRAETNALNRSQFVTASQKHRNSKFPPFAFTKHGAIMAATILNSPCAVEMSLYVVRAFVRLRELLASNAALTRKLDELERKCKQHDEAIATILAAIRELTHQTAPKRRGIGFTAEIT